MTRLFPIGLLGLALLLLSGCAMSVPIRPWMFIQNEPAAPLNDPAQPAAPVQPAQDEVLPG